MESWYYNHVDFYTKNLKTPNLINKDNGDDTCYTEVIFNDKAIDSYIFLRVDAEFDGYIGRIYFSNPANG